MELAIHRLVLLDLMKRTNLPEEECRRVRQAFEADCAAERLRKIESAPSFVSKRTTPVFSESRVEERFPAEQILASPDRPVSALGMIERFSVKDRSRRYVRGSKFSANPDGDFEPVTSDSISDEAKNGSIH